MYWDICDKTQEEYLFAFSTNNQVGKMLREL